MSWLSWESEKVIDLEDKIEEAELQLRKLKAELEVARVELEEQKRR